MPDIAIKQIRNQSLDFYKGIAIMLVIIGHTLQYRVYPDNFDSSWVFKIIYSFHMPLFVFLSGAVASTWLTFYFDPIPIGNKLLIYSDRLKKSAIRLLIPFASWTIVKYYAWGMDTGPVNYLIEVFKSPDNSLWFLLAIFYCIVIFSTLCLLVGCIDISKIALKVNRNISLTFANSTTTKLVIVLIFWLLIKKHLPSFFGVGLAEEYLTYFILGSLLFRHIDLYISIILRLIPYIIFLILIPAWDRIKPYNYNGFYGGNFGGHLFSFTIAIMGSFIALDLSNILIKQAPKVFISAVAKLGKMSLGIYALHTYFLETSPIIFAPTIISLIIAYIILWIPGLNLILLGESKGLIQSPRVV